MIRSAGRAFRHGTGSARVVAVVATWLSVAQVVLAEDTSPPVVEPAGVACPGCPPGSPSGSTVNSLSDAIEFARDRQAALKPVVDYTATFSKAEFIDRRLLSQTMDLKFRRKPFSVYLRCHSKLQPAREAIFVAGMNDDKLLLHESGLKALITMSLKPDDPRVMAEN